MEGKRQSPARAFLVFGAPASGKTQFSEQFAKKYHIAYFNLAELREEYGLSRKLILMLVRELAKTHKNLVFEGEIDTEKSRAEIRNLLRAAGYSISTIWIQTDAATIRNRLKQRYRSVAKAREFYDESVPKLEAPSEVEHPIILSGKHTFETQARHVLAGLANGRI